MKIFVFVLIAGLVGAQGFAQVNVPTTVRSTTDRIQPYSNQTKALKIKEICRTLAGNNMFWGTTQSKLTCVSHANGIIELNGYSKKGTMSVFANSEDKMIVEVDDDSYIYFYQNSYGQSLTIRFTFVASDYKNLPGGRVQTEGSFEVDVIMRNESRSLRVGALSDNNLY